MSPIGHGIFKSLREKRVCPHCLKEQVVSKEKKDRSVDCKRCGKPVPPPRTH